MGVGYHEKADEENPQSEDEKDAETRRLNEPGEGIELKKITTRNKDTGLPQLVPGTVKPMFKTHHLKYAIFTFNGILAIFGLLLLVIAVWVRVDPEFLEYNTNLKIESFYAVCHMLIVVGLIIFFIAFVGCVGAFAENQLVLTVYFIIFTLLFIVQLAAVIMIFSAPYSKAIRGALEKQLQKQIEKREEDEGSRFLMDLMQQNLECCGSISEKEYHNISPRSCQDPRTGSIYQNGCTSMLLKYLRAKAGLIGGISVPVLLFQIFVLTVTFCLLYNIKNESKYDM